MASHERATLSLLDKVNLTGHAVLLALEVLWKLTTRVFHANKVQPWKKRAVCLFIGGHRVTHFPPRYLRALLPTTGQTIRAFCSANSLQHDEAVISVGNGYQDATLHFIKVDSAAQDSGPMIVYFHGGGFHYPSSDGPLLIATSCAKHAKASLAVLEYSLAPEARYPTQLVQAVAALRHVLAKRNAADIILAGDSAGGNLVLALLAHMIHKSPYAPEMSIGLGTESKLRGALLLSPWVNTDFGASTFDRNSCYDFLHREQMQRFSEFWQPNEDEVWANPCVEGGEFWARAAVKRIMLTTGTWEVFYNDELVMAERLRDAKDKEKLQLLEIKQDVHVGVMLEAGLQLPESNAKRAILKWFEELR